MKFCIGSHQASVVWRELLLSHKLLLPQPYHWHVCLVFKKTLQENPCRQIRCDILSPAHLLFSRYVQPGQQTYPGAGCALRCWCPAVAPKGHQTSLPHQLWPGEAALCPSLLCACAAWSRGDLNKVHISGITDLLYL